MCFHEAGASTGMRAGICFCIVIVLLPVIVIILLSYLNQSNINCFTGVRAGIYICIVVVVGSKSIQNWFDCFAAQNALMHVLNDRQAGNWNHYYCCSSNLDLSQYKSINRMHDSIRSTLLRLFFSRIWHFCCYYLKFSPTKKKTIIALLCLRRYKDDS